MQILLIFNADWIKETLSPAKQRLWSRNYPAILYWIMFVKGMTSSVNQSGRKIGHYLDPR
jgi:hypothetical protein